MKVQKYLWLAVLLGITIWQSGVLSAQQAGAASPNTTVVLNYNIRKIYTHRLGYRIDLVDYIGNMRTIYAKADWFVNFELRDADLDSYEVAASLNYLPLSSGLQSNYLTLRYEGGKLVSMVIYVDEPSWRHDSIWFALPASENVDNKFAIQTVMFTDIPGPPAAPAPKNTADAQN